MKPYYIMIHFDGPYVTGFVVPQAKDPAHALKILKTIIRTRIMVCITNGINLDAHMGDDNVPRLKEYMRSLKRPWRIPGGNRTKGEKKAVSHWATKPVVRIEEMILPIHAGYWLKDIITGKELCNTASNTLPAEGTR